MKRHLIQIPAEQVRKLQEIAQVRKDLQGFPLSKIVHLLLQERMAELFQQTVIPISADTKSKWFEYVREQVPLHVWAPIAIGVVRHSQEMIGIPFTKILVCSEPTKVTWCTPKRDIYAIGNFLLNKLRQKAFARAYYQRYNTIYFAFVHHCKELREKDFALHNNEELYSEYSTFYEECKRIHGLTLDIDAIDIVLEQVLKEKMEGICQQKGFPISQQAQLYNTVTTPIEPSYVRKEELEIERISKYILRDQKLSTLFEFDTYLILEKIKQCPELAEMIQKVSEQYWWTDLGWASGQEKGIKQTIEAVKKAIRNPPEKVPPSSEETKQQKMKLKRLLGFDEETDFYIDCFEKYSLFHDYRKELQMKSTVVMNKFLQEIAKRKNYAYEDLRWCWPSEVKEGLISGKINMEEIEKRKENFCYLVLEETIEQYTGEEAIHKRKEELSTASENITDFEGITASAGKVSGTVRVCFSPQEAQEKVKKGDILVTSMTTPDYVPVMKQAGAILTNEGGVTCHAAIVSRELGIPCLVGTKIATKVLRDGDFVEVNANHSRVKVLQRVAKDG